MGPELEEPLEVRRRAMTRMRASVIRLNFFFLAGKEPRMTFIER